MPTPASNSLTRSAAFRCGHFCMAPQGKRNVLLDGQGVVECRVLE